MVRPQPWLPLGSQIQATKTGGVDKPLNLLDCCVGVGVPRKRGRNVPEITLSCLDGRTRAAIGWVELRQLQESGQLPEGAVATTTAIDEPLPGGPRRVERKYLAPSARANREEDYRITWEHFETVGREA